MPDRIQPLCDRLQRTQVRSIQPPPQKHGWLLSHEINEKSPMPTLRAVTGCFCGTFFWPPEFPSFFSSHESQRVCAISLNALSTSEVSNSRATRFRISSSPPH